MVFLRPAAAARWAIGTLVHRPIFRAGGSRCILSTVAVMHTLIAVEVVLRDRIPEAGKKPLHGLIKQGAADGILTERQAEPLDCGRNIRNGQTTHAVMPRPWRYRRRCTGGRRRRWGSRPLACGAAAGRGPGGAEGRPALPRRRRAAPTRAGMRSTRTEPAPAAVCPIPRPMAADWIIAAEPRGRASRAGLRRYMGRPRGRSMTQRSTTTPRRTTGE